MRIIFAGLILATLSSPAFADDPATCGPAGLANKTSIERAIWAQGGTNPVTVLKVCGLYAKAQVQDLASGVNETAFLKKANGQWTLLDKGAAPDAEKLGVPKEAQ